MKGRGQLSDEQMAALMQQQEQGGMGGMPMGPGMGGMGALFGMMGMFEWQRIDKPQKRNPKVDEVTFFIPDDQYLPTQENVEQHPENRVFMESYMEIMHTSMAPGI